MWETEFHLYREQKWTNYGPYLWSLNFIIILRFMKSQILPIVPISHENKCRPEVVVRFVADYVQLIPSHISLCIKRWSLSSLPWAESGLVSWLTLATKIWWKWHWWNPRLALNRPRNFRLCSFRMLRSPRFEKAQPKHIKRNREENRGSPAKSQQYLQDVWVKPPLTLQLANPPLNAAVGVSESRRNQQMNNTAKLIMILWNPKKNTFLEF